MPYLNETGLAYYNEKLQPWISSQPVKTIPSSLYPWTLSEKAGAVTCWPVGGTELKPTVDFMFTETPPVNGQPKAPDNPSTITGVSSVKVTRCGKNIFTFPFHGSSSTTNGITFTVNSDGTVSAKGTASSTASFYITYNYTLHLNALQTYVMSGVPTGGSNSTYYMQMQGTNSTETGSGQIISGVSNPEWVRIRIASGYAIQGSIVFKPQLELGSAATAFEPYSGADYTLPLGNTFYGGTLDVASGVMTVTRVAVPVTQANKKADGWDGSVHCYIFGQIDPLPAKSRAFGTEICTHFAFSNGYDSATVHFYVAANGQPFFFNSTWTSKQDAIDFFSAQESNGTPVTVVYEIATPQTVQLSLASISALAQTSRYEPRLNTIYTDASAVQVGYVKSPIREEYELQQAIVAQGGNI